MDVVAMVDKQNHPDSTCKRMSLAGPIKIISRDGVIDGCGDYETLFPYSELSLKFFIMTDK
jgi:hypothetical protein